MVITMNEEQEKIDLLKRMARDDIKVVALREAMKKLEERQATCAKSDRMGLLEARLVLIDMIIAIRGYDEHNKV